MNKLPPLHKPPMIFSRDNVLRVYLDATSVAHAYGSLATGTGAAVIKAYRNCIDELRKLNIFSGVAISSSSVLCDIFITISELGADDGATPFTAGVTKFKKHSGSSSDYAEIKMNSQPKWLFAKKPWWSWGYRPRFERWLNHELLHAIGAPHTTDMKAPVLSILDEENWMDNTPVIPPFDRALARRLYNLPDPYSHML
jgi:hypothetical protein